MNKGIIFIIVVFLVAGIMFYLYKRNSERIFNYHFKGEVQSIRYDEKGFPDVTIDGTTYYLFYGNWSFRHAIQKSDTLEKKKNSFTIKLIKYKTGELNIRLAKY